MGTLQIKNINITRSGKSLVTGEMNLYPGSITVLYGDVGTGKSTFLQQFYNLNQIECYLDGKKIKCNQDWISQIGYVDQDVELFNQITMREFKYLFLEQSDFNFDDLNISYIEDKLIKDCSKGEKQRISILRALSKNPRILLLDEPFSFLDDQTRILTLHLLKKYTEQNLVYTLIVSHYLVEQKYVNQECFIKNTAIENKQIGKVNDTSLIASKHKSNSRLIKYVIKKKIKYQVSVLFMISLLGLFGYIKVVQNLKTESAQWFDSHEGYVESNAYAHEALPIYKTEKDIMINGKSKSVTILNYYDGMNMHPCHKDMNEDVLVSEDLYKNFGPTLEIVTGTRTYNCSNYIREDIDFKWENTLNTIYDKDFTGEEDDVLFYVIPYKTESDLQKLDDKNLYKEYISIINPYKIQVSISKILISMFLILAFYITHKRQSYLSRWVFEDGISGIQYLMLHYIAIMIVGLFTYLYLILLR